MSKKFSAWGALSANFQLYYLSWSSNFNVRRLKFNIDLETFNLKCFTEKLLMKF
jgi:hypothetical protein